MAGESSATRITLVVAVSESLYRDLLVQALSAVASIEVIGAFPDGEDAQRCILERRPRVALLDTALRGPHNGLQLGMLMKRGMPDLGVVWLSERRPASFIAPPGRDVSAGWAYLLRPSTSFAALVRAIEGTARGLVLFDAGPAPALSASSGDLDLTPRQRDILALMADGLSNPAIAETLRLHGKSVENQINQVYSRLEIDRQDACVQPRIRAVLEYVRTAGGLGAGTIAAGRPVN